MLGNWCLVVNTLDFVVEVVAGWVLSLVELFRCLMWDMLYAGVVEGR
jgi:hypothetical protein